MARLDQARPIFIPPLLQPINNSQIGSATTQQQFPPLEFASNSIRSHGGYGTFAMTAAGLIYALDNSNAAMQALDPGETLIDTSTVATMDGTTQVATITIHDGDNPNFDLAHELSTFAARAWDLWTRRRHKRRKRGPNNLWRGRSTPTAPA